MCGRLAIDSETDAFLEDVVAEHGIKALHDWQRHLPTFNIAPTNDVPVILHSRREGSDVIATARWSLVPPWAPTLATRFPTFNARSESVTQKVTWRGPIVSSRCLVPASGYYEWVGSRAPKTPHWIAPAGGDPILMFAGLYSWWADPERATDDPDRWHLTTAIMTMPTVAELADIHDRNPVALPQELWWDWIDPDIQGDQGFVDTVVAASRPVLSQCREHTVAPVRGDGPQLIQPV